MELRMITRGEVWLVRLDPTEGHEQSKTRPCVVISNTLTNASVGLCIAVPFTGRARYTKSGILSPDLVEVIPPDGGLTKISYSIAFQIRSLAHSRFVKKLGVLSSSKLDAIVDSVEQIVR